jgi:dolichol-phosphate mannosyltransferase
VRNASAADWHQLIRFCLVGASGVVVNMAVFTLGFKAFALDHTIAAVIAFAVAWSTNFALNKHWTFRRHGLSALQQGARNLTVSLVGLALQLGLLNLFVAVGMYEVWSQLASIALVTPLNFLLNRRWSFR